MKQNKITYEEAILMLKAKHYQAPNKWEKLESELTLNDNLSSLKKYKAPDDIWSKIQTDLEVEMPQKKDLLYQKLAIGLIALLILIYVTSQIFNREDNLEKGFVYKSEVEIGESKLPEFETNMMAYKAGSDYIELNEELFPEESYTDYQKELKDLDIAITKIKRMQEEYGQDASSLKMLSKLERQKADLIKSMINRV